MNSVFTILELKGRPTFESVKAAYKAKVRELPGGSLADEQQKREVLTVLNSAYEQVKTREKFDDYLRANPWYPPYDPEKSDDEPPTDLVFITPKDRNILKRNTK